MSAGQSFGSWVSFCGRSIPIRRSLQGRKIPKVEKPHRTTTPVLLPSANPAEMELGPGDMGKEGMGEEMHDKLRRAWDRISGNY